MTRLYFVRHGESNMNLMPDIIGGRSNHTELTEKGVRQAKAFGRWLADSSLRPDVIYFSPAVRTIQTMDYSLEAAGIDTVERIMDLRIQELSQGINEGAPRRETYTPEVLAQIAEQLLDFKFDDGESIQDVMDRKLEFALDMANKHPDQTVLVYSHGFAIRSLAGAINALPHHDIVKVLETPNVSLSSFHVTPESQSVKYVGKRVIDEESV